MTMNLKSSKQECISYNSNDPVKQNMQLGNKYTEVYKMESMK